MADVEKNRMQNQSYLKVDLGQEGKQTFDYVKALRERKKIEKEINKIQEKNQADRTAEEKKHLKELEDKKLQNAQKIQDLEDEREEKRNERREKTLENAGSAALSAMADGVLKLKSTLDSTMNTFLQTQESIAYNLNGTAMDIKGISKDLTNAIAGTGIVRQEAVYTKINEMVRAGIVYNVEQRAFLQTLSDDLGMMFNATDGSLVRLINLQRKDLTDERMAIQASLKTFLNQNYETSQYIVESFQGVSNALLEAQSIMTTQAGMEMEATVQKWLGSLSSVGMSESTIQSLATAIGQLGSGNLSALQGSNMQNLIVMGAAQSGLSYADLLTQGVSAQAADSLMQGIVRYIAQMGGNSSNVVKSEYARIFGLNVSDIVAASQVGAVNAMGGITTKIDGFLNSVGDYMYTSSRINKGMENFMYEWATGVASSDTNFAIYKALDVISGIGSALTAGITVSTPKIFGAGADIELSKLIGMVPLLSTIGSLATTIGDTASNLFNAETGAASIFAKLGAGGNRDQYIRATGSLTGFSKTSGLETSGSMIIANTSTSDMANTSMTSSAELVNETMKGEETTYDITDLYNYIDENWQADIHTGILNQELIQFQRPTLQGIYNFLTTNLTELLTTTLPTALGNQSYGTYTRISEAANTVRIGNDLTTAFDLMLMSTMHLTNIYGLLAKYFGATETFTVAEYSGDWNKSLGWLASALPTEYNLAEQEATGG